MDSVEIKLGCRWDMQFWIVRAFVRWPLDGMPISMTWDSTATAHRAIWRLPAVSNVNIHASPMSMETKQNINPNRRQNRNFRAVLLSIGQWLWPTDTAIYIHSLRFSKTIERHPVEPNRVQPLAKCVRARRICNVIRKKYMQRYEPTFRVFWYNFAKNSLGDGAIDVGNNNFVVVLPSEQIAFASRRSLVRRRYTEHHLIHALFQIQTVDLIRRQSQRFPILFIANLAVDTFLRAQCRVDGSCWWIGRIRLSIHVSRYIRCVDFAVVAGIWWWLTFDTWSAPVPPWVATVWIFICVAGNRLRITWMVQFGCLLIFQLFDGILCANKWNSENVLIIFRTLSFSRRITHWVTTDKTEQNSENVRAKETKRKLTKDNGLRNASDVITIAHADAQS